MFYSTYTSKKIFEQINNETLLKAKTKSIEFTNSINTFTSNVLMKYTTDLKLISRYTLLFNGKNYTGDMNTINRFSKFISNNNNEKHIINADTLALFNNNIFLNIYIQTNQLNLSTFESANVSVIKLDYSSYYKTIFVNDDNDKILNKLLRMHQELNYISYYYFGNNKTYNINNDKENQAKIKYLMTIFKSIYIKRLITNKLNSDIIRIMILNEDELIIYPPEDYRKINLISFRGLHLDSECAYDLSNNLFDYPLCVYKYMNNYFLSHSNSYIFIMKEQIVYDSLSSAFCIKFPFLKNKPDKSFLCFELDLGLLMASLNVNSVKNFEFGLFNLKNINIPSFNLTFKDNIIVYDNNKEFYPEFLNTFNSTIYTPQKFIINSFSPFKYYSLYHFLYFNTTKLLKEHNELLEIISISKFEDEYNYVLDKLFEIEKEYNSNKSKTQFSFNFKRTICRKKIIYNDYECFIDENEMNVVPVSISLNKINDDIIETNEVVSDNFDLFLYSIISTNPKMNKEDIHTILLIKIIRVTALYILMTLIIVFFFIIFINILSEYSFNSVEKLIEHMNNIEINEDKKEIINLKEEKSWTANNEMAKLKDIYELMRRSLLIKQAFEKENFLKINNLELYNLVQDIKKKNIKEICNSFLGYFHYNNHIFNLSEKEFYSTINFIKENENKLKSGENDEYDDKLKDAIKRSSNVSYLNEYSKFEKIDENMLDIIYLKIFKQRFIYLYAMTKFQLGNEMIIGNIPNNLIGQNNNIPGNYNKNKNKKNKEKQMNYFKDAIKYFQECKNINSSLGINQIKIIYSLIMISKCYIQLNDYKNSIININEALSYYFKFSKTFKEYHSKYYNPKAMLFVENNIFHYILFTFSRICHTFNKPCASNWIILKIFESSPFLLSNIHYHAGINLLNFLGKNKTKMNKYQHNFYKNTFTMKESEKTKKNYMKIISRLYTKNSSSKNQLASTERIGDNSSFYSKSGNSQSFYESITERNKVSSHLKKDTKSSRISTLFHNENKRMNKIINICLSEKILEKINGPELKDVLIKYFQKYFVLKDNDKFSFIQFATNGKKTASFKLEYLTHFLTKFQKTKDIFELTDSFQPKEGFVFMELYNIFDSIIKSYSQIEETDNIIMIFIDSEDIRFSSVSDCLNIVDDLNKKNTSVYFFSFEEEISEEKINNIQSFLNGLAEGYFFQIKNYQELKQIFINISSIKYQTNFFGYEYDIFDHFL